jgi:hypothetical protein
MTAQCHAMRIYGPGSTALARESHAPRRAASGTFRLDESESTRTANSAGAVRSLGGIEALVALQGIEDATERRRRAVSRGRRALDVLDEIKVGLLGGRLDPSLPGRLQALSADLQKGSGEPGLDNVLAEIDLRVQVEIAKMTRR